MEGPLHARSCLTAAALLASCHPAFDFSLKVQPPVEPCYSCMCVSRPQVPCPD
ncbi:hypothetical protein PF005_g28612 [Phytophthora fragariae]|uniref:Uncharacterized protein n=2 Tax=Phytophthora TaxID=4783 RepID=A0A6A3DMZ3_9STRA|nr:hypothetical protein PF003_g16630 [Phytophthora fragariae]KAE8963368.1 hypothetical protein PR001_g29394 [Phytophthora rubi]KAE8920501.1 hypothetical protein PF009_g29206 [Phytophthora fragariae]KAE8963505.1 hypothetical protein PR002_g29268 [Phytophthora rubi]KAE8965336.1 hypothetical protein PF011_g28334 [Phytophthora fragariae]